MKVDLFEADSPNWGSEIMTGRRLVRKGVFVIEIGSLYTWIWSASNKQFYREFWYKFVVKWKFIAMLGLFWRGHAQLWSALTQLPLYQQIYWGYNARIGAQFTLTMMYFTKIER